MPQPYVRLNIRVDGPITAEGIADSVTEDYREGRLPAKSRLPPVRVLAHQLGVSKNTVQAAYEELTARDIVEAEGRLGVFVKSTAEVPFQSCARPVSSFPMGGQSLGGSPEDQVNLSSVFIDPSLLPVERIEQCYRFAFKEMGAQVKADYQGFPLLREVIAQRLTERAIDAHPDNVITTVGSQHAIDLICRVLKIRRMATENPCYAGGKRLFGLNDIELIGLPVDPFRRQDVQAWEGILQEEKPDILYLTTNFQNPTGYSYSSEELAQIAKLSSDSGVPILEDDWGSDMLSHSEYRPPLRALAGENVLYLNSFSKKVLPTLRVGYLLAPEYLVGDLVAAKRATVIATPAPPEMALAHFLQRGYYDHHIKKMQEELDRRYLHCLRTLEKSLSGLCRWTLPGGGPLIWLEIPPSVELRELKRRMAARGFSVDDRLERFLGTPHLHGIPIGFAYLSSDFLERGIDVLASEIRALYST